QSPPLTPGLLPRRDAALGFRSLLSTRASSYGTSWLCIRVANCQRQSRAEARRRVHRPGERGLLAIALLTRELPQPRHTGARPHGQQGVRESWWSWLARRRRPPPRHLPSGPTAPGRAASEHGHLGLKA